MEANELVEKARNLALQESPDYEKAYNLLLEAHNIGSAEATYAIATWYLHGGNYLDKDYTKGTQYLKKAAEKYWPAALYDLAISYERGLYVKKNRTKAFHLYLQAAIREDAGAISEVARCYYYGIGTRKNRVLANIWYDRSEELENIKKD